MDPAGLAIGVIGLAGLFSTCLDAADKIDDYRHFKSDSHALATQFKSHRLRLEQWGRAVGLEQRGEGTLAQDHHEALDDTETFQTVQEILYIIRKTCNDGDDGPGSTDPTPTDRPLARSLTEPFRGASKRQKVAWSLRGKVKRTAQVEQFGVLVQHLHHLVPLDVNVKKSTETAVESSQMRLQPAPQDMQSMPTTPGGGRWMAELRKMLEKLDMEVEAEVRRELHAWLIHDSQRNELYDDTVQKRLDGTCDWILNRPAFLDWLSSDTPSPTAKLLWINGPAGFGKTVLCASVVNSLVSTVKTPVAHFFFSSDFESRNDPYIAVRSWISQVISADQTAFDFVRGRRELENEQLATRATILQLFQQVAQLVPGSIFVLDGLDECTWLGQEVPNAGRGDSIAGFLEKLGRAASSTETRILIVSRDEPEIRRGIESTNASVFEYKIAPEDVEGDTKLYSRSIVDKKLSKKSESLKTGISQKMAERCGGQFLWLKLQEDSLRSWKNQKQLEDTIDKTPSGLDLLYQRDWTRMSQLPDVERDRAFSLLRWAAFALRPLTVCEIAEAMLIDMDSDELPIDEMPDSVDEEYIECEILGLCGSLLNLRESSSETNAGLWTVRLTHFSVKQYFLSHSPTLGGSLRANESLRSSNEKAENTVLSKLCLCYINLEQVWQDDFKQDSGNVQGSFRDYAAELWHRHVDLGDSSDADVTELIDALLDVESPSWEPWRQWFDSNDRKSLKIEQNKNEAAKKEEDEEEEEEEEEATHRTQPTGPLYYAARLDLTETALRLIENQVHCLDEKSYSGETALLAACRNGNETIARVLIESGANIALSNAKGETPLHETADAGHLKLAQLLLENGAEATSQNQLGYTPLHDAAKGGHVDLIRLLLKHGADIMARDKHGFTPLHTSAKHADAHAARLLLDEGAELMSKSSEDATPLNVAAIMGQVEPARLLLERGADLSVADSDGWTPLISASCSGSIPVIRFFLDSGADIHRPDDEGRTALIHAALMGQHEVIEVLLEKGADVNATGEEGTTALHYVSSVGDVGIARILLRSGADATAVNSRGRSPLSIATSDGRTEVVKLLLEHGADDSVRDIYNDTPLLSACGSGQVEIVRLLLENGADKTVIDENGNTPLSRAIYMGHATIVEQLLEAGIDGMAGNCRGWRPLSLAANCGHVDIIRLLIDTGCDPTATDADGWTPLHSAASSGRVEAVKFFLEQVKGCDIEAADNSGKTPLHVASLGGHADVVEMLLKAGPGPTRNEMDNHGRTPLFYAAMRGHDEVVQQLLLSRKAGVDVKDRYGSTALCAATRNGHVGTLEQLLAVEGISLDGRDFFGKTVFWWANKNGNPRVVELLEQCASKRECQAYADDDDDDENDVFEQASASITFYIEAYWCDVCTRSIQREDVEYYECSQCDGGDFLACVECVEAGARCSDDSHDWRKLVQDQLSDSDSE